MHRSAKYAHDGDRCEGEDHEEKGDLEFRLKHGVPLRGRRVASGLEVAGTADPDRNICAPVFRRESFR